MVGRRAAVPGEIEQLVVRAHLRTGQCFGHEIRRHCLRRQQPSRELESCEQNLLVCAMRQIVGLDDRKFVRVGGSHAHMTRALGPLLARTATHSGKVVEHVSLSFLVAAGREQDLDVAARKLGPRFPEHVHQRRAQRDDAGPSRQPLRHFQA